jgi:hypothetical protein
MAQSPLVTASFNASKPMWDDDEKRQWSEADYEEADRAMPRHWPSLKPTEPKYGMIRDFLAWYHHEFGKDSFELRYSLRPPKNRTEELTRQYMAEQISEEELGARLKADAERPIDLEMLTEFHRAYEAKLEIYSRILQALATQVGEAIPRDERKRDREIDTLVAELDGQMPLWIENLETVSDFLGEVRAEKGLGLITIGEFEGNAAHWLAQLVFRRTIEAWKSCIAIAHRSQTNGHYLYRASACSLFRKTHAPLLPVPQGLSERMTLDFNLGRAALKEIGRTRRSPLAEVSASPQMALTVDAELDNESRALLLVGDMLRIVASAGQIFRPLANSDWGIDGEIEFKDDEGHASGQRVYVQLKSGDSHLTKRKSDGAEIFQIKKERHAMYWQKQHYPVMLVIRTGSGLVRWMEVSEYLKTASKRSTKPIKQIVFEAEETTVTSVLRLRERQMGNGGSDR